MRRLILFLLVALPFALACGGGGGGSPSEPSNTASLVGAVHAAPMGPGIPGTTVTTQGRTVVTAADGRFSISGLAPGATSVMLSAQGYRPATLQLTLAPGNNTFSLGMEATR